MILQESLGVIEITCGGLLLIAASVTLWNMHKRESIRFLKFMTWLIIATSLLVCFNGCIDLLMARMEDLDKIGVAVLYGLVIGVGSFAVFSVVWFVTFKYWETAKQLTIIYRALGAQIDFAPGTTSFKGSTL